MQSLTPAQQKVLELVAQCHTSREIAERLGVSYRTVQNHRAAICKRLGLEGSNALLRYALSLRTAALNRHDEASP